MRIHVVQPGESLWLISKKYGVSQQKIADINKLQKSQVAVPGQSVVIPVEGAAYTVKAGDTIWSIAKKYNIPAERIIAVNNIANPDQVPPGTVLQIPEKSKNYGFIEVNAYVEPGIVTGAAEAVSEVSQYLTYISPFSYQVNTDASLIAINDTPIINAAKESNTAALMVVTNFGGGNFNTPLAHDILNNENLQNTLINNILVLMRSKGYYGLNIDFERIPPEDRERYNSFLRRVTGRLHRENYIVSTALAPKSSDVKTGSWHGAHDYRAHGEIVDFVIIMTYEWGWSGGPPMAVAPINQVRSVLNFALSVMPGKKIIMGMPLYGYDWTLPYMPGGEFAARISQPDAVNLAAKYGSAIKYDEKSQSPHFSYRDGEGKEHEVWFEDARSVEAKLKMASQLGLRGVSYWELGVEFPQNWAILDDMFNIVKVLK